MKAAILHSADSVPVYGDYDDPVADVGTQIVELVAAGIHHVTRSVATGRHYSSGGAFPLIPGLNAVGRTKDGDLSSPAQARRAPAPSLSGSPHRMRCGSRCLPELSPRQSRPGSTPAWRPGCR
ncbi:MAG TPA: hypothetical protein VMB74_09870 [Streptosporangiaceae bacterium]|nr:hypothetical protein [Streptosporangiaceae bacterium]